MITAPFRIASLAFFGLIFYVPSAAQAQKDVWFTIIGPSAGQQFEYGDDINMTLILEQDAPPLAYYSVVLTRTSDGSAAVVGGVGLGSNNQEHSSVYFQMPSPPNNGLMYEYFYLTVTLLNVNHELDSKTVIIMFKQPD